MTDGQSRAEYYRQIALKLSRLAEQTRHFEVKQELLDLAGRFERIAEHAEKWQEVEE